MYRRRRSPPGPSHNSHEGEPWLTSSSPSVSMLSVLAGLSVWSWPSVSGGKIVASSKRRTNLATQQIVTQPEVHHLGKKLPIPATPTPLDLLQRAIEQNVSM